MKLSRRY
jgi:hypothetical protein